MHGVLQKIVADLLSQRCREIGVRIDPVSPQSKIFGDNGVLDSLGLVTMIADLEDAIREKMGVSLTLADERAMSRSRSPFLTVQSLSDYAAERLEEAKRKAS